jgi:two-component system probable response regulator PhcQ
MLAKILIVDDQALVLGVLKEILSRGPYSVYAAQSAEQALEIMAREAVDVVISDERMPGMRGSEFLTIIRNRYPDTVRIIITGHASLESTIRAINEGEIYRLLTKPVTGEDLHAAVKDALAHKAKASRSNPDHDLLAHLEKQAPGITRVKRDEDGAVIISEDEP